MTDEGLIDTEGRREREESERRWRLEDIKNRNENVTSVTVKTPSQVSEP